MIDVVCGIIYHQGYVLICRRKPNKKLGGFWEFPGGKIDVNEKGESALHRELMEELGVRVIIHDRFSTVVHEYDFGSIRLAAYTCEFVSGEFNLTDHDLISWVDISELNEYKLAPADIPIANQLISQA